ncbi:MAG: cytochrome c [Nitrospira sp.]|nr:cytochrome c [Nitrospira sp.]
MKLVWLGLAVLTCLIGCSDEQGEPGSTHAAHEGVTQEAVASLDAPKPVPEEYETGEERFNALCARCHGREGRGTNMGPPLVHKIYEPSHHADFAFMRAAKQGVRAHHWKFGNMPRISEATPDDVTKIIAYIRWLQRQAGIF